MYNIERLRRDRIRPRRGIRISTIRLPRENAPNFPEIRQCRPQKCIIHHLCAPEMRIFWHHQQMLPARDTCETSGLAVFPLFFKIAQTGTRQHLRRLYRQTIMCNSNIVHTTYIPIPLSRVRNGRERRSNNRNRATSRLTRYHHVITKSERDWRKLCLRARVSESQCT